MKALVLSDIHGRLESLEKIMELIHNKGVGLVLVLGDLTNFGGKKEAKEALEKLKGFEVLAIPGNLDTPKVLEFLEKKGISLHAKKKKAGNFTIVGFGGGTTKDNGVFLSSEEEIKKKILELMEGEKNTVLVTHLPPFGTKLDISKSTGENIGSKAVKEVIEEKQPVLHFCGHAHNSFGEQKFGKTTSINVAAVKEGRALIVDLEAMKWKRIQL